MLKDYRDLAASLKEKFQSITYWPEIELNNEDNQRLKELDDVTSVGKHSFQIQIESNHCVIPGQYILYAICIKELALSVKEHLDVFEIIKEGKSQNEIGDILISHKFDFSKLPIDDYSKHLALQIFFDDVLNQGAKSIVNGTAGNYTIRGLSDFYTSIILKPINIPAASSSILGKFIYKLSENVDIYSYLEKRFINQLPYITKEKKINRFVKNTLSFLIQYDGMAKIKNTFYKNSEPGLTSIKDKELSLTSIFKSSSMVLDEKALSMGDKLRFFKEPLYYNENNEFVYLSTEWTDGTESRLDLETFKKIIDRYYSEFTIITEKDTYFLKCSAGSHFYSSISNNVSLLKSLIVSLHDSGIQIQDKLVARFTSSLLTKPFVILTGLSGSGKTKLAQAFAMWICEKEAEGEINKQYCIVPVGADWTNREPLLGFPNALKNNEYVKPENKVLDLILEANKNNNKPYFLILDEMNLSHVERYFADFLSVMESKTEIALHYGTGEWNGVPSKIGFPKNLFIIGTVNIDETTYMFSPKVLDRANVIEFRVTAIEMAKYLTDFSEIKLEILKGMGKEMANNFIQLALDKHIIENEKERGLIIESLNNFFSELKKCGAEFGYRSAYEIIRFTGVAKKLDASWEDEEIIDAAIMQKLLPKVHGSRRKLEPILKRLGTLCLQNDEKIEDYISKSEIDFEEKTKIKYPISLEKILRMYQNLISNGFTSYAEA